MGVMLRVWTWNVWDVPTALRRRGRMKGVEARLRDEQVRGPQRDGPDVVLLQEAWSRSRRERLLEACGWPHAADRDRFEEHPPNWLLGPAERLSGWPLTADSGLLLLSRFPVRRVRRHVFRARGRWGRGEGLVRKSAVAALLDTPLGCVWFVNTHLCAPYRGAPHEEVRAQQVQELGRFVESLAGDVDGGAVGTVVAGDFNISPGPPERGLACHAELWGRLRAALPGFHLAPGAEDNVTSSASRNPWCAAEDGESSVDHVFVGTGLVAASARLRAHEPVMVDSSLPSAFRRMGLPSHGPVRAPLSDHFAHETTIFAG